MINCKIIIKKKNFEYILLVKNKSYFRKYLCVSEHNGQIIVGNLSKNKKTARLTCALKIFDCLIIENKIQNVIKTNGKKIKLKTNFNNTERFLNDKFCNFTHNTDYKSVSFFFFYYYKCLFFSFFK